MIRENLEAGSRFLYVVGTPGSGVSFGWRSISNGNCASATQAGILTPQWVKLTRANDVFTAQYSPDGKTWTDITDATTGAPVSTSIAMLGNVYIGLCVTSHNASAGTTGVLSNVSTTGGVTGPWQPIWIGDDPDLTNGADDLYVAIEDSAGKIGVSSSPTAVNAPVWTEWAIPLSDFAGVNLARIKKMYLGVGDRDNPTPDGAGRVYIDDISLTKPVVAP